MTPQQFQAAVAHIGSVRDLIDRGAVEFPNATFLIDPARGDNVTYADLRERVRQISHSIHDQGIPAGSTVAYALGNSTSTVATILAIQYGGFIATAINLVAGSDIIAYVLDHSEAALIVADEVGQQALLKSENGGGIERPIVSPEALLAAGCDSTIGEPLPAERDGLLMYTSGTTGRPKGVVLTHKNLIAGGANSVMAHQLSSTDKGLCVLPLYHINGLCVTVMGALVSGGSLIVPTKFSVTGFWQLIRDHGCTWFSVVPTQISYLLHQHSEEGFEPVPNLRFGRSASAPLSPEVQHAFEARFGVPVIETMGLTETAAQILSNPLPPGKRKVGSPGIAYGNEVMIADEHQTEVQRGVEGEILVRGPNVMRGYLKNQKATNETLTNAGWLRTGDLGRMDEDGYCYVTGRLKELIIKGGENIAPREIDEALYSHPDVVEAAAFSRPCDQYGETVEAAVMLCEGSAATQAELMDMCRKRLGEFKTPDNIHLLPELPKGPSGKIQRVKILETLRDGA